MRTRETMAMIVVISAAGAAAFLAGASTDRPAEPAWEELAPPARPDRDLPPSNSGDRPPLPAPTPTRPASPPAGEAAARDPAAAEPAPDRPIPEDPEALAGWLLSLDDGDLDRLRERGALDRHVVRVLDHHVQQPDGEERMGEFLARINERILARRSHQNPSR